MRSAKKFQRKDETIESMKLKANTSVDEDLLQSLVDQESGPLKAGLLPQLDAATASGSKELLNSISQECMGLGNHVSFHLSYFFPTFIIRMYWQYTELSKNVVLYDSLKLLFRDLHFWGDIFSSSVWHQLKFAGGSTSKENQKGKRRSGGRRP